MCFLYQFFLEKCVKQTLKNLEKRVILYSDKEENGDVYEKKSFFTNDEMEK